jgi:hypothetical protein
LLDRTRHLPRDFVQLLKCIQQAAGNHKRRLTEDIVASGFRNYSRSYFLAEIRDELAGHFSVEQRDVGLSAIAKLRAPRFTSDQFAEQVGNAERDAHRFITSLYDCGALGTAESGIYTYKYRNPHMPFNADADIVLHRALAPAFNVAPSMASS